MQILVKNKSPIWDDEPEERKEYLANLLNELGVKATKENLEQFRESIEMFRDTDFKKLPEGLESLWFYINGESDLYSMIEEAHEILTEEKPAGGGGEILYKKVKNRKYEATDFIFKKVRQSDNKILDVRYERYLKNGKFRIRARDKRGRFA